jgi:hypothetical protein
MEKLKKILDMGFVLQFRKHRHEDYQEKPELMEGNHFRLNVIRDNDGYMLRFDVEYGDDYLNGFEEIFDDILDHINMNFQ